MSFAPEFYRKDIDGLRALAIIAVVAYHARIPFTPGGFVGVDVFFVLSGFLITSLLRTEARNTGTVSLRAFYARRIRRLFPALFVVVIVTCLLGSVALVPVLGQQEDLAASGVATALYVSNFYFWLHAPGYFDDSSELQPLLHTWSLSVEEQFYLLWPPIVLAIAGLARRRRWDLERTLLFVTLAILVVSAGWCIRKTFSEPIAAFYLLPSRAWELATGAALALWLPTITARRAGLGGLCSLLGIAAIVAAVSRISVATPFPGYAAALPVFGTALVVLGGHLAERNPVQVVLGWRPLVLVGLLSYSWYLWHWPLLALVRAYSLEAFDPVRDLGVAGASLLVAYASYRLVENPIRYRRPGPFGRNETTIAAGLAMSLAMCVPALALGAWAARTERHDPALRELAAAKKERSPLRTACHQDPPFERLNPSVNCIAGDAASAPALLLWGDSHADQLSALMQTFARSSPGTPIEVRSFSSCPPLAVYPMRDPREQQACSAFNAAVLDEIRERASHGLRGVVLSARWLRVFRAPQMHQMPDDPAAPVPGLRAPELASSLATTVQQLTALGLRVLIVAPIPEMRYDIPYCLARRPAGQCDVERAVFERQRHEVMQILAEIRQGRPNVEILDMVDALCPTRCLAKRDGRVVFRDDDHLTPSASRDLLPIAAPSLLWAGAGSP